MILTIKMPFHTSNSQPEAKTNVFDLESLMSLQTSTYMYKTALKESDQNIRQFKNSQKWLIHVTSPYNIQTLSSKQIMIILELIRQKLSWSYIKFS